MSSGGGGGSTSPTQQNITTTTIPDYAKPYVESLLGQAQNITDLTNPANRYQPFQGEQYAQFTPLQQQAFQTAGTLGVNPYTQMAASSLNTAAAQAMGTQYNPADITVEIGRAHV